MKPTELARRASATLSEAAGLGPVKPHHTAVLRAIAQARHDNSKDHAGRVQGDNPADWAGHHLAHHHAVVGHLVKHGMLELNSMGASRITPKGRTHLASA